MYTLPKDAFINKSKIKDAILFNEAQKPIYDMLEDYYLGKHAISTRKKPGKVLKNNKIVVNHAKFITDINTGYLLGNPVEYQPEKGIDIEPILQEYKKQTISDVDHEVTKMVSIYGMAYDYTYALEDNSLHTKPIDPRNCIIIYDNTFEHEKMYAIIYKSVSEDQTKFYGVSVIDSKKIMSYSEDLKKEKETKHSFGVIPVVEYRNNSELNGDFEVVLSLIDAYNQLQSDRINDKEQLVDAILVLYGMSFTPEQAKMLKKDRMLADVDPEARAEYVTKELNEADADTLRAVIESDIHKISMTPNLTDENFIGNSSGVAIRYKLIAFEQSIKNKQRYLEKGLLERFKIYNNYLVALSEMSVVETYQIDAIFKRNLPQNDYETSQMINNLDGFVDRELMVGQLSFVPDAAETVELARIEALERANALAAQFATEEPNIEDDSINNNS